MDRKIAVAYVLLVAITTILASLAAILFGPNSSLESIPGIFERSGSVWFLFATPVFLAAIGLAGAVGLASTRLIYAPLNELSPDAQQGLERHRSAERRLLIGVGILVASVHSLVILHTAGFAVPLEFGARASFFVFGALFASAGNMIPKIPFFSRWWQIDRASYTKIVRFSGWAIVIAGILFCLLAVFAPIENIKTSVKTILGSMVGLLIVNALLQVILAAKNRE